MPATKRKLKQEPARNNVIQFPVKKVGITITCLPKAADLTHFEAMTVFGTSLEVWGIQDGDSVIINSMFRNSDLTSGKIVVYSAAGSDQQIGRKIVSCSGKRITLRSGLDSVADIEVDINNSGIQGIVTAYQRSLV